MATSKKTAPAAKPAPVKHMVFNYPTSPQDPQYLVTMQRLDKLTAEGWRIISPATALTTVKMRPIYNGNYWEPPGNVVTQMTMLLCKE